jgi:hypothetical protein
MTADRDWLLLGSIEPWRSTAEHEAEVLRLRAELQALQERYDDLRFEAAERDHDLTGRLERARAKAEKLGRPKGKKQVGARRLRQLRKAPLDPDDPEYSDKLAAKLHEVLVKHSHASGNNLLPPRRRKNPRK